MKIVFFSSDNSVSSGAFLCLAELSASILQSGQDDALVILPQDGNGTELLDYYEVPHKQIKSFTWCVKKNERHAIHSSFGLLSRRKKDVNTCDIKSKDESVTVLFMLKNLVKRCINLFSVFRTVLLLLHEKPDVIHINTIYNYTGALAGFACRIPVVWHLREYLGPDQGMKIWDEKQGYSLISRADRIVTVSRSVADYYRSFMPKGNFTVVYDGISNDAFYKPNKRIFQNPTIVLTMVGALYRNKGQFDLVDAVNLLRKETIFNCLRIQIIGEGESREELQEYINEKGLQESFELTGYQKDVEKWLEETDIFCMCSWCEAFGRVTVEAMLSGCLVIGAGSGGTLELIRDMDTGVLFEVKNPVSLAEKIHYALEHKDEMRKLAENGRVYAKRTFSMEGETSDILKIYKELIRRRALNGKPE